MKSLFFASLVVATFLFSSCTKDSNETKPETQLLGKWNLKRWTSNDVVGSSSRKDTGNYNPGQYLQFESGGQCIARIDNEITQTTWKLLDENKTLFIASNGTLDVPDDGFAIKTLNGSSLVLYSKETIGTTYYEVTIYLER